MIIVSPDPNLHQWIDANCADTAHARIGHQTYAVVGEGDEAIWRIYWGDRFVEAPNNVFYDNTRHNRFIIDLMREADIGDCRHAVLAMIIARQSSNTTG